MDQDPCITSGKAAKLVGVCTRTVRKWHALKLVDGYLIPGKGKNQHLRVSLKSLRELMASAGGPTEAIDKLLNQTKGI